MRLKNKKIIVTAAAQGIGKATALAFANEGASVLATDINEDILKNIKNDNENIKTKKLDCTNKNEVEEFCKSVDRVDILFHAVGFVHHGTIEDCDSDEFYRSINVNIYSAYLMSYFLLPKMFCQISPTPNPERTTTLISCLSNSLERTIGTDEETVFPYSAEWNGRRSLETPSESAIEFTMCRLP